MTPQETLDKLRSLTDPTPEQLREASDLALLARGWTHDYPRPNEPTCPLMWKAPNPAPGVLPDQWWPMYPSRIHPAPHSCASLDDAVRWMVPKGCDYEVGTGPLTTGAVGAYARVAGMLQEIERLSPNQPFRTALALTIAGLSATLEGGK